MPAITAPTAARSPVLEMLELEGRSPAAEIKKPTAANSTSIDGR